MTLATGSQFGRYEIRSQLGVGGMGEVYRARDNRLNRDVALKVLLDSCLRDQERMARFEREAQVLASLNHPNIASIYGLEETNGNADQANQVGLVMELIEGPTLADRLRTGPITLDEALPIAKQLIDALEVAHERNIIHRDLKPANIKVTEDGVVKVLDFGLAKVFVSDAPNTDLSHSPTLIKGTEAGVILGTAAYMSPEQAKGKVVDKRSDIWAFGCVLFEMLSGKQPFVGETLTDTLASVVRGEPDWNQLPATTPLSVKRLIKRCLEKDVKQRLRDIGDARFELEQANNVPAPITATQSRFRLWTALLVVAAVAVLAAFAGAFVTRWFAPKPTTLSVIRTEIELPVEQRAQRVGLAISPDGTNLVYEANQRLFLRPLNSLESAPIAGTEGGINPFFSPDGNWIGFWVSGQIKKVQLPGGIPVTICSTGMMGASWGTDDTILIGGVFSGILRVPASGGNPAVVVQPQPSFGYDYPQFLPDGRSFLYLRDTPGTTASNQIVMRSLDKDDETMILPGAYNFTYLKSGILVYTVASTLDSVDLQAVSFDPSSRKVIGQPVMVAKNVAAVTSGTGAHFAVSENGTLVYPPAASGGYQSRLVRVTETGQVGLLPAEARLYSDPRVSFDGHSVAAHLQGDENDVWVVSVDRGTLTRLSFSPGEDETPVWSPNGRMVAWSGSRTGVARGIFRRSADASGSEELIWRLDLHAHVRDWTPDGKALIFEANDPKTNNDIWRLDLEGAPKATPIVQTPFIEHNSRLSPDGQWIAYSSNESGRDEIYLQPYPQGGSRLTVTTSGGDQPVWSRDGQKIYFQADGAINAVDFVSGPQPSVKNARVLFPNRFDNPQGGNHTNYDAFPDGRLLMLQSHIEKEGQRTKIVMVFNWLAELKQQLGK